MMTSKMEYDLKIGRQPQNWTKTSKMDDDLKIGRRPKNLTTTSKTDDDFKNGRRPQKTDDDLKNCTATSKTCQLARDVLTIVPRDLLLINWGQTPCLVL